MISIPFDNLPTKTIRSKKPRFFYPNQEPKKIGEKLWLAFNNFEETLNYWMQEYQLFVELHKQNRTGKRERPSPAFHALCNFFQTHLSDIDQLLQEFRSELRTMNCSKSSSKVILLGEMKKIERRINLFNKQYRKLKLEFYKELYRTAPARIF